MSSPKVLILMQDPALVERMRTVMEGEGYDVVIVDPIILEAPSPADFMKRLRNAEIAHEPSVEQERWGVWWDLPFGRWACPPGCEEAAAGYWNVEVATCPKCGAKNPADHPEEGSE